jgi:hypothetical protein
LWFSVKIRVIKSSFLIDYTSGLCTSIWLSPTSDRCSSLLASLIL